MKDLHARVVEALEQAASDKRCEYRADHQSEYDAKQIDALASELADKAIVPVEPTEAMLGTGYTAATAALAIKDRWTDDGEFIPQKPEEITGAIYRAMLRASDEQ